MDFALGALEQQLRVLKIFRAKHCFQHLEASAKRCILKGLSKHQHLNKLDT
jgi:hypothetical protein